MFYKKGKFLLYGFKGDTHNRIIVEVFGQERKIKKGIKIRARDKFPIHSLTPIFLQAIIFVSAVYLLYYYREGGIKDVGIFPVTIRDAGGYVNSGLALIRGENPYLNSTSRWGSFGPIFFGVWSILVPRSIHTLSFQLLNLIGIYWLIKVVFPHLNTMTIRAIFLLSIWSSAFRELLSTNQISGIVLGLVCIGYKSFSKSKRNAIFRQPIKIYLTSYLPIAIAIDVKPHIALPLLLIMSTKLPKRINLLAGSTLILALGHLLMDVRFARLLELDFYNSLRILNSLSQIGNLGDSVTYWPIISKLLNSTQYTMTLSMILSLLTLSCTIWAIRSKNFNSALILVGFFPAAGIYFHLYDSLIITVVFITLALTKYSWVNLYALNFLMIPKEFMNTRNWLLILAANLLYILIVRNLDNRKVYVYLRDFILTLSLYFGTGLALQKYKSDEYFYHSVVVTFLVTVLVAVGLLTSKNIRISEIKPKFQ
jgi:hypothetical protein